METIKVTLKPSGKYPTWMHNELLDILNAPVLEVGDCRDVTSVQADGPGATKTTQRQCLTPGFWDINY
ncbi:hypothetical protein DPSP01_001052 [Paraphaeosphaeria sporulosa]